MSNYSAFFRKPWMKFPIYAWAFGCAFYGGIQLSTRLFPKLTYSKFYYQGVTHPYYTSSADLVSKFRLFENVEVPDTREKYVNYLAVYSTDPLTKNEMVDQLALTAMKEFDFSKLFRVKRVGKDREPMFWCFGKIHGLENLAFASEDEIYATNGNPVKIQQIVNKYDGAQLKVDSFEHLIEIMQESLKSYKQAIDAIDMNSGDKKKLLALPFYLAKR
jgi:hypothetical protein